MNRPSSQVLQSQENAPVRASISHRESTYSPAEIERNKLIELHLPLVDQVLARLRRNLPRHVDADDLHSAGVAGLIAAAQRYNPAQAKTFAGYVCLRIRGSILDELRRLDTCPRRSRARNREIQMAVQTLEQLLGRAPNDTELSRHLGITLAELDRRRQAGDRVRIVSLDAPQGDSSGSALLHETIPDADQESVRDSLEKSELIATLANRVAGLPEIEKKILAFYYHENMRFAEIAEIFDLTESRISQLHKQALGRLKNLLKKEAQRVS